MRQSRPRKGAHAAGKGTGFSGRGRLGGPAARELQAALERPGQGFWAAGGACASRAGPALPARQSLSSADGGAAGRVPRDVAVFPHAFLMLYCVQGACVDSRTQREAVASNQARAAVSQGCGVPALPKPSPGLKLRAGKASAVSRAHAQRRGLAPPVPSAQTLVPRGPARSLCSNAGPQGPRAPDASSAHTSAPQTPCRPARKAPQPSCHQTPLAGGVN